ncbi:hypothetical protein FA10DRAFT_304205 [Acaromyces ingoldii]|uniref:Uncharacterized protein n=1 Tax=Acaromyces ingoldii TaxID=215250 RepID=A0A316YDE1_9BASI|nr:hypothetical protein FA10DRAFT_304205 [Acaromyces ingoldii]PWN87437.1 hypothetical protein FA10DRAFT_304205 [Acaromyces ingoldii]
MVVVPSRPRLPGRAVSDVHPLVNAEAVEDSSDRDLGRGTKLAIGGGKVTSGAKLALGGRLPMSPFLPLPPAPPAEDLKRQANDEQLTPKGRKDGGDVHLNIHLGLPADSHAYRRASSNGTEQQQTHASRKARQEHIANSAHMIRSYSMPVATQREFDVQRQRQWQGRGNFVAQHQWAAGWPAAASLAESNSMERSCTSAPSMQQSSIRQQRQAHGGSPRVQPRSPRAPLSSLDLNPPSSPSRSSSSSSMRFSDDDELDYFSQRDRESSISDEAEALTPRALTPEQPSVTDGKTSNRISITEVEEISFDIHPSHLQPPAPFAL